EVDAEADALEHAISPRLEQALADHLGEPREDPHGHPIPTPQGDLAKRDLKSLDQFRAGQHVVIREVQDDNPERLRRWQTRRLTPLGSPLHHPSVSAAPNSVIRLNGSTPSSKPSSRAPSASRAKLPSSRSRGAKKRPLFSPGACSITARRCPAPSSTCRR